MEKELISIIVPCYNVSHYLDDLFLSLKSQTYKNIEYIFVDDGSSDDTLSRLFELDKKFDLKAKIVTQKNSGPSAARNKGLSYARGTLVYFGDADDMYDPNLLFVLEKIINENNSDISCCKHVHVPNSKHFNYQNTYVGKLRTLNLHSSSDIVSMLLSTKKILFTGFNKLYRMSILKQIEGFPNVWNTDCWLGEDLLFNLKYCSRCNNLVYTNKTLYYCRLSKNSLVRSKFNPRKLTTFKVVDYFNTLDQIKYAQAIPYLKTFECFSAMDFLIQISRSDFNDVNEIKNLYERFRSNVKYCRQGKMNPWYRKYFMWITIPFVRLAISKKIKNR